MVQLTKHLCRLVYSAIVICGIVVSFVGIETHAAMGQNGSSNCSKNEAQGTRKPAVEDQG